MKRTRRPRTAKRAAAGAGAALARQIAQPDTRARGVSLLVTVLALLAGCGGDGAPDEPATELQITVWAKGRSGDQDQATLRCGPAGGSLPRAEEACRRLERMDDPLARPGGDVVCIEIYGGPAVAEVRGTLDGKQVDTTFARTDGCEIALWDRHQFLFPVQPSSP